MEITKLCSTDIPKLSDGKQKDIDRISGLPDDILIHILAFLPTKIYVATSILGRRWRFLWARVPNLDFNGDDLCGDDGRVSSIMNMVIFLHKRQTINSFRFCHYQSPAKCSDFEFEKWITTAVERKVQKLDLSLSHSLMLPSRIFNCKTLVNLSLSNCLMPITDTLNLPALKKLQLHWVNYKSVELFGHLLSGCPVLDELFIKKGSENNEICISSPTINRLELEIDYDMLFTCSKRKVFGFKLDTPALKYLKFNNYVPEDYSEVPRFAFFASAETFHFLTDIEMEVDWRFIPSFLAKADNLEVLTIRSCHGVFPTKWVDPEQVPACLVSRLGTIRIHCFGCKEQEFKAVRYILRNAKVLRRMEIFTGGIRTITDLKEKFEAVKKITLFERGSETCQVAFR